MFLMTHSACTFSSHVAENTCQIVEITVGHCTPRSCNALYCIVEASVIFKTFFGAVPQVVAECTALINICK